MGSGLLKKANLLSMEKGLAFSNFLQKYNNLTFAIFTKKENYYFISNSLGFDGESILASYSTIDFWEGLIPEKNKIYNFSSDDNTLIKMLQFFSFDMKEKIQKVSIYFNENKIIFLCNEELSKEFIHDVTFLTNEYNSNQNEKAISYNLFIESAVNSYILEKAKFKSSIHSVFRQALNHEIFNRIILYFSSTDYSLIVKDNYIKITTDNQINEKLVLSHLIYNLRDIIDTKANLIELLA